MRAIIFSRDRAMQLDACLRSLATHAAEPVEAIVIVRATTDRHTVAYEQIEGIGAAVVLHEASFELDVRGALDIAGEHVLFAVDDTVFVRRFSPAACARALDADPGAIGFSLRLGRNVTWTYPTNRAQAQPTSWAPAGEWVTADGSRIDDVLGWHWPGADGDWGYPLEVSSSIYRTADVMRAIGPNGFVNPNHLEALLDSAAAEHHQLGATHRTAGRSRLLCPPVSVAFSVPCNKVQTTCANRAGAAPGYTAEALLSLWEEGYRIDVAALAGYTPSACHEEVALPFVRR